MTLYDRNPKKVKVLLKPKPKSKTKPKPKSKTKPKPKSKTKTKTMDINQLDIENQNMLYRKSKYVKELIPDDFYVKNLNDKMMPLKGKPTIIVYYAHWCPHCHSNEMIQLWEALAESLSKKTDIQTAAFNADLNNSNREIAESIGINGFPTIQFSKSQLKSPVEYTGTRDPKNILLFLKEMIKK
jgi:thiol-disulfide isomerase/thioredoxin